jgi:hypothetical protein
MAAALQSSACTVFSPSETVIVSSTPDLGKDVRVCTHVCFLTCMSVTLDGVWIGNWIYLPLTDRNYKIVTIALLLFFLICIVGGGIKVHSTLRPLNGLLCQPRVIMIMEKSVE